MRTFLVLIASYLCGVNGVLAQKGTAEPDFYPRGYALDTWTGEVTGFDNERRTLTLSYTSGKKTSTFVAVVPDAPYEWGTDARKFRVVDFPFDKKAKEQVYIYVARSGVYYVPPEQMSYGTPVQKRPNPPDSNVMGELKDFVGRTITIYYTTRERIDGGAKEEYNDVWRIRIYPKKK